MAAVIKKMAAVIKKIGSDYRHNMLVKHMIWRA